MTTATQNQDLIDDLEYAARLAREGASAPLLGGPVGLMWTSLAVIALLAHGLVYLGIIPIAPNMVGLIWAIYGTVGTVFSVVLGRRIASTPTATTVANRVSGAAWPVMGAVIAALAIAVLLGHILNDVPVIAFDFIMVVAFAMGAVINGALGALTGAGYLKWAAWASGAATVLCAVNAGSPYVYLLAAGMLVFSGVIPSWIETRRAARG